MRQILGATSLAVMLLLGSAPAFGAFGVTVSGSATEIFPPIGSTLPGALTSDSMFVWYESTGTISPALGVDHDGSAGMFFGDAAGAWTPTVLGAGTAYNSYAVHFDSITDVSARATLTFSSKIIGMSLLRPSLDAGDAPYGSPSAIYPTGVANRGLDEAKANDRFSISLDGKTLMLHLTAHGAGFDQIRIFTSAVPEPASLAVWSLIGLVVGGGALRRRRKAAA